MFDEQSNQLTLEELAKRLKAARKSREKESGQKIPHKMIAEAIGVDRVTVAMWEQGKKHPGFLNIVNYCNFIGITLDELLDVKKTQLLSIELTEEERTAILAMVETCEQEPEISHLHQKLQLLKQYLRAFLGRAQGR